MNNEIQIFNNDEFGEIRTVVIDDEPWFVAVDVCKALEINNPTDALKRLDEDEKARFNLGLRGGETNCVNEPGLYGLVLGSRKPEAKAFKRWIKHEVLPAINHHGAYMTPETIEKVLNDPDTIISLARQLKEARAERDALSETNQRQADKIALDAPKVLFANSVEASSMAILVGELAKILKQNGVDIGQNRLFEYLRENGFLIKRQGTDYNMPTQKAMNLGLFEIKETVINHSDGHITVSKTPKVTGRGQQYFINKFLGGI